MAIIKVLKRENPYVQIDKIGVDDSNLSGCIINGVDGRNFYQCHFLIKKS